MCKCQRCGKELKSGESIQRGYGPTCYKIVNFQNKRKLDIKKDLNTLTLDTINITLLNLTDRLRKVELANAFLKARDKNRTLVISGKHGDPIERIKREEAEKINDPLLKEFRSVFTEVISELKSVLKIRKEKIESREIDISQLTLVRE